MYYAWKWTNRYNKITIKTKIKKIKKDTEYNAVGKFYINADKKTFSRYNICI